MRDAIEELANECDVELRKAQALGGLFAKSGHRELAEEQGASEWHYTWFRNRLIEILQKEKDKCEN